ncbi:Ig-like domain-containing protein [Clostridium septicum]|uniref:Ig-like domain-containing protein n=1 Tax=Clostridium septicum TaxID=1504 RepID=UPI000FF8E9E1|nr:Ig-like domain-containing protein [Clostridium septicum]QAS62021.1 hypothetical protein EI377_15505 [Clostridium septicum]
MVLPEREVNNTLEIENPLKVIGIEIPAEEISNNGERTADNKIKWSNIDTNTMDKLQFTFNKKVNCGRGKEYLQEQ